MSALADIPTDRLIEAIRHAREGVDSVTVEDLSIQLGVDLAAVAELDYSDLVIFTSGTNRTMPGPGFEVIPPIVRELIDNRGEGFNATGRAVGAAGPTIGTWYRYERKDDGRTNWRRDVIPKAREWVEGFGSMVTLRQLFYRLVSDRLIENSWYYYSQLSSLTAELRREGRFPDLLDRTSTIRRPRYFSSPEQAKRSVKTAYRRDRTIGQPYTIILAVEKAGMSEQLWEWFSVPLGIQHVALGGYASQSLCQTLHNNIVYQDRPAVLIYAGDFDPTGTHIDADLVRRIGNIDHYHRVALNPDQLAGLPEYVPTPGELKKLKADPRKDRFLDRYGLDELVQYEVDALDPNDLRELYDSTLQEYWDEDAYDEIMEIEEEERESL